MTSGLVSDLNVVADLVQARPGLSRAAAARKLRGRRASTLERLERAVAAGLVHEAPSAAAIRGRSTRTVAGLFPGPSPATGTLPGLDVGDDLAGAQLREARLRAGVPASVLAEHLGISRRQLHRWESGQTSVPPRHQLRRALEAAQTGPQEEVGQVHAVWDLVQAVRRSPGRSRYMIVGRSQRRAVLLEQALAQGLVHLAPAWGRGTRQKLVGVYPGGVPTEPGPPVLADALRRARIEAGWSQDAIARRLDIARTTVERWERDLVVVPGWATTTAAAALAAARAACRDQGGAVLAAITAAPGSSRQALARRLGYTHQESITVHVEALLASGAVHERHVGHRGQASGLYLGPVPAQVLTPEELIELRTRAGLRQRDVAERASVPLGPIRRWEEGRAPIPLECQEQLRAFLEVLPDAGKPLRVRVLDLVREKPRTRHQLDIHEDLQGVGASALSAALTHLEDAGLIHQGRIGAGVADPNRPSRANRGRSGYLPGPLPHAGAKPPK